MRVSVITAVRNAVDGIGATLMSVGDQRQVEVEHIVIDGASTDGTLNVIKRLGSRVSVLVSEQDSGVYDAFNKGLRRATGEVIGFLNAGDAFSDSGALERLCKVIRQAGTDAAFGDVAIVDPPTGRTVRQYRSSWFRPDRIPFGYMPAHPTLYIRREVYERSGGYNASYKIAGDFEFVARVFGKGGASFTYLPETLVYMANGGLSNSGLSAKWLITTEMHRACRANGIPSSWLKLLSRLPRKYFAEVLSANRSLAARRTRDHHA